MDLTTILYYLAPLIGIGTLVIGVSAMLQPQKMSEKFGIKATGTTLPYVVSTGVRDVFIGLTVLVLFYFKNWSALGYINLSIAIVAISDFAVVLKHGNKKTSIVHAFGAVLVITYGFYLICQ